MKSSLSESVLRRLTNDALASFLGESSNFEMAAYPGLQLALSNEPIADMNMLAAGKNSEPRHFQSLCERCLERELPFLAMIFPEAGTALDGVAKELGLVYAVDFPMMVQEGEAVAPSGNPDATVSRVTSKALAEASAQVTASAYSMPIDSVRRCFPMSFYESPGVAVYVASLGNEVLSSVTLTFHGDTCGIWAMGTNAERQHGGVGRRLLSTAMAEAQKSGFKRFFLGATPAGFKLYETLGFVTVVEARVWASGETHQA